MQKIHLQYFMGNSQNIILLIKYSTQDDMSIETTITTIFTIILTAVRIA